MKKIIILFFFTFHFTQGQNFTTEFEKSKGKETATYQEVIDFYTELANTYREISLFEAGQTDSGLPLQLILFNYDGKITPQQIKKSKKNTILINNGIHPGEPDGIDASMMMLRNIVQNKALKEKFKNIIIAVIPVYNVGGSLNRNSSSRVNQNGPLAYGFRGNARNFDLNRDFIKNDTKNSVAFSKIFHWVDPDIFIDNHVSNGADYQYVLTHLLTQHNKLGGKAGEFLHQKFAPELVRELKQKKYDITPYVNVFNRVPEGSFSQFFDSPRYSTGYTTLFNSIGMMVETHMLKPYDIRVKGTYQFMLTALDLLVKNGKEIRQIRKNAYKEVIRKDKYPILWQIDSSKTSTLQFKGFEGKRIKSEVTGLQRLKYDRSKPFTKPITYYNFFKPKKEIVIPKAYIIPQGWLKIIQHLKNNNIYFYPLTTDTVIEVENYHIADYKTSGKVFEGHYVHYNTQVSKTIEKKKFRKGDLVVPTDQKGVRYLLETLEPEATDSFFNWNFFDTILQRKEGFSPYVFEDLAVEILKNNPELKKSFKEKKRSDKKFSQNWYAQLNYIYTNSKYQEKAYLQYPVYRIVRKD
ncbi:MAG: hypothetical protein DSY82_06285 [Flavobacteriia bacterium]|nr:MAG: hypothetical protein DSY82_06285 [Flavobacteriia bacterium]